MVGSWSRVCAALLVALSPAGASALRVSGVATGVIDEHATTEGEGAAVFGLDQSELLGTPFRIDFSYDTALLPADEHPGLDASRYVSEAAQPDWLDLAITVNGRTVVLRGEYRLAGVFDSSSSSAPPDSIRLAIDFGYEDAVTFRREFLDFSVDLPRDALVSAGLPIELESDEILAASNNANFRLNEFDLEPASGDVLYHKHVSFGMDVRAIRMSAVPEPGSAALVIAGLLALGVRGRTTRS